MNGWHLLLALVDLGSDALAASLHGLRVAATVDFNLPGSPSPFGPLDIPGGVPPFIPGAWPPGDGTGGDGGDGGDPPDGPPPDDPPPDDPPPDECEQ